MGAVPNVPIPVLRGIGVLGGYYVPTVGPCISPAPHLCRARGQPPRYHCSLPEHPPSRSPAGTWESSLQSIKASLRPGMIQGWGWIKGHAGFVGNEISDAYSKWAAHVMVWDPSLLPPPPIGCISRGPLPVIQKLTTTSIKRLLACHGHENIHAPSSFPFYNHTSWFQGLPFKCSSRKLQHGAFCFPRRLAPSPLPRLPRLAPNGCYLFRLTLPYLRTPGANLHSVPAPPLHHGGVPMVVSDHTRRGEAQFRPGACPHVPVHQTHNPPLRPKKTSTLS